MAGPDLAALAIKAGLVDEYHLFVTPIVVGGGKHFLPDSVRLKLSCLTNVDSATAWFTFTTAPGCDKTPTLPGRR